METPEEALIDVFDSLERLEEECAPITRLPHFDIYAHDLAIPSRAAVNYACSIPLRLRSGPSCSSAAALLYLDRYIHFISGLIDQNSVSIWCSIRTSSREWSGTIVAERSLGIDKQSHLVVVEPSVRSTSTFLEATDFSFHLSSTDGSTSSTFNHLFSITAAPNGCHLWIPFDRIPKVAIKIFVDQLQDDIPRLDGYSEGPPHEGRSVLNWHATGHQLEPGQPVGAGLLHELIEAQARQNSDHCAIEFLHPKSPRHSLERLETWTYKELSAKSDSVAGCLKAIVDLHNPHRSEPCIVPVFLTTSPELYISYLAILKAGFAFCPLPVDAPAQRLRDILNDIRPLVALSVGPAPESGTWAEASRTFDVEWLDIQHCSDCLDDHKESSEFHPTADSLAYLMYTSGSTGKPKGVQITHYAASASIAAHMKQYRNSMPRSIPMRWYQFAAPTFDPSIMEIFVTLCCGGTLCCAPREMMLSSPEEIITETRSTVMMATPSFASMLDIGRMPTLNCLWTMGETLNRQVIDRFTHPEKHILDISSMNKIFHPNLHLCNAYGPTEAAINVTFLSNVPKNIRGSIIGYPLEMGLILINDTRCTGIMPVPLGFVGELVIGGAQVSTGYLQRPNENSTAFVTDERYGRLYYTGDRARVVWDPKGVPILEFLGRLSDDQVKVNGQRVELGEIESILCTVPEIRNAVAAIDKPDSSEKKGASIVAYLLLEPTAKVSSATIEENCKDILASRLPPYMQPAQIICVDELPRTAAGKIDRRKVRLIASKDRESAPNPPTTQDGKSPKIISKVRHRMDQRAARLLPVLEKALETIGISYSSRQDLRYCLDSLSALRFLGMTKIQNIGYFSLKDVLHARSLEDLAEVAIERFDEQGLDVGGNESRFPTSLMTHLDGFRIRWQAVVPKNLGISPDEVSDILPTTIMQDRLLLGFSKARRKTSKQRNYVHHSVHRFSPKTDFKKLKDAWSKVFSRHDVYRTIFMPVDDEMSSFAQIVVSPDCAIYRIRWIEQTSTILSSDSTDADIISVAKEAESILDLGKSTPVLTMLRTPNNLLVVLSMLHAVFDLSSLHLLLEEVATEIEGKSPPSRTSLRLAVETNLAAQGSETDAFWDDYMNGHEPSAFPPLTGIRPEIAVGSTTSTQITSSLTMGDLEKRSRSLLCSPVSALQAAWSSILHAYISPASNDVAFGTLFAGRLDDGADTCMAPTFSVVPTRVRLEHSSLNIDILRILTNGNARASRHLSLSHRSKATSNTSYDTAIALQFIQDVEGCSDLLKNTEMLPMAHDYAVMIEAIPDISSNLFLKATYSDEYLGKKSAEVMLLQLDEILVWILANPMLPYSDSLGCTSVDKLSILNPRPRMESPAQVSLLQTQFELNVLQHADRTALEFYHSLQNEPGVVEKCSYSKLNSEADKLAMVIQSKFGDTSGAIIPILMEKRPELYIAVLGVLKAGAAWSPIDTNSPAKRRLELITRLGSKILLVCEDSFVDKAGIPTSVEVLAVPTTNRLSHNQDPGNKSLEQVIPRHSIAYLIWTSGTTGAPKGVPITHAASSVSMSAIQAVIPGKTKTGNAPRCIQFSQHTFDVFVQDLFYTWGLGGTIISASREIMTTSFAELSRKSEASHAFMTPAFAASVPRGSCPTLEVITMIGEKLPQTVADDWGRDIEAYNTYGPAEATVVSTLTKFSGIGKSTKSSNIGKPLPSLSCSVLRDGKEVMIQGIGELALSGLQLANGYLGDPAMTSARFVRWDKPDTIRYLTGDTVRQLADGSLDFIGREDDLVKLGGIRVELSEISFSMKDSHQLIRQIETCYLARKDRAKAVVSFIAANLDFKHTNGSKIICTPESADIARCAMSQATLNLPRYMVPSNIFILLGIPKTSSAKVDRHALQKAYDDLDLESWEVAISTDRFGILDNQELSGDALKVKRCLSDFCGVNIETIHVHSSLNSLGIDSLSAARFVNRLSKSGISLRLTDLLQSHTVGDMLRLVKNDSKQTINGDRSKSAAEGFNDAWLKYMVKILGEKVSFVMPATTLQDGVLSESMVEKSSYWSNHMFQLRADMDGDRLHSAWALVCRNTQALRTSFVTFLEVAHTENLPHCPSSLLQVVCDEDRMDWAEVDVDKTLHDTAQERFNRITSYHQSTTFNHPPWALTIINTDSSKKMMLTIHHAIHDAESITHIISDLASAYSTYSFPARHQITEALPFTIDYSTDEPNDDYWREMLHPYTDTAFCTWPDLVGTEESARKAKPKSMISEIYHLELSSDEITHASRAVGTRMSIIFKVAFGCLLLNYLETPGIVFAEIVSQRGLNPEFQDAIAPLVTTIPVTFTARQTLRELLLEQSRQATESRARGSPSGPLVRKALHRSPHQPLYPAFFVFHAENEVVKDGSDSQSALWSREGELLGLSTEHDVSLNVYPGARCTIELIASDRIMQHENLKTFCQQIESLVTAMLRSPDGPLLGLLDDADPDVISLSTSRLPEPEDHPCNSNPIYWLEYHAQHHADWNAIEVANGIMSGGTKTQAWTYSRLLLESRKIANFIKEAGHSNKIIAMCTGRTLQSYAIIVGILMSGNTYLPIDDGLPHDRKLLLLEDSDSALLFTDESNAKFFESLPLNCVRMNVDDMAVAQNIQEAGDDEHPNPDSTASAYLLYTSGSTGKPKGVLVSFRSLCGFIEGLTNFMGDCSLLARSRAGVGKWLGLASRAFDVHLAEMFLAWRSGLCAVTAPRESLLDDLRLALTSLKVTHAICVPSLLEQADLTPDQLPDLVFLTIGGEKISKRIVDTWAGHTRVTAINAYGPTELAIGCSASHIVPNFNVNNIGFPYANTSAHILVPETDHYAYRGQVGELCFTGCLVGNGYLNRPDAKGFVDFRGKRMYRTGDMARMLPDGSLMFLGRRDDQTKLRGQRLELSEISESIRISSESPIDVVTLILGHPAIPGTFLISFVSDLAVRAKRYGAKLELNYESLGTRSHRIRDHCSKKLPTYMVPDYVIPVNIIPLAKVSGKADSKALKAFFTSLSAHTLLGKIGETSPEKIQRRLFLPEQRVAAVVKNTLLLEDVNDIQARTNLFALGLDSLNAIGLMMKLREIGLWCSLIMVLGNPTVESIASLGEWHTSKVSHHQTSINEDAFRALRSKVLDQDDFKLQADVVEKILPCLPMQESTITSTLNSRDTVAYINHVVFELQRDVDTTRFKKAWLDLIDDTPILRTVFFHYGDKFVQAVLQPQFIMSPWIEDANLNVSSEVAEVLNHDIVKAIEERPPLRLHLKRTAHGPHIFTMAIHHALYDGHSFDLMMKDLWLCYQSRILPPRTYLETLLSHNALQDVSLQELFWTDYLKNASPSDSQRFGPRDETSASVYRDIKFTLLDIQQAANKLEVTIATLLTCVFAIILARKTRISDVIFGFILFGRSVSVTGVESIRAPCINTLPQRIQFQSDELVAHVIKRFQSTSTKCLEYQHTSLRDISRWTGLQQPMFDSLFSFSWNEVHEHNARPWIQVESSMALGYPLAIEFKADKTSNTIFASCEYTGAFGDKRDAESLIGDMEILLAMITRGENPSTSSMGIVERGVALSPETKIWDERNWSADEITIRNVLEKATGIVQTSIAKNASFFQLGVDSVTAISFAKSLRNNKLNVRSSDIMLYPCIGSLAHHLSDQRKDATEKLDSAPFTTQANIWALVKDELKLSVDSLEAVYSCTPLQAGMITSTLAYEGDAYVYQHDRILPTEIDTERFCEAWAVTVQSLDILRTSFHYSKAEGPQWIACVHHKMPTESLELHRISDASSSPKTLKFVHENDFRRPPHLAVLSRDGDRLIFQLTLHHALYDGISLPMIFDRLFDSYRSHSLEVAKVPPFYQCAQLMNELVTQSPIFWLPTLKAYSNSSKHVSLVTARQLFSTRNCRIPLKAVIEGCKALRITLQTILLTAYSKAIAIVFQKRDIALGHVVSGRSLPIENCENIVGPLFNSVPLRIRFDHLFSSNKEMMDHIQGLTIKAQAHQYVSLAQIQDEWRKKEGGSSDRIFDSLFLFQKVGLVSQGPFLRASEHGSQVTASEYCLNLEVEQSETEITLSASCHECCVANWLPETFLDMYEEVLANLLDCAAQAVGSHPPGFAALPFKTQGVQSTFKLEESKESYDELSLLKITNILAKVAKVSAETVTGTVNIFALGLTSLSAITVAAECRRQGLNLGVADVLRGLTARGICNQMAKKIQHSDEMRVATRQIDFRDLFDPPVTQDCIESIHPALSGQVYHLHGWLQSARSMYMPTWTYTCSKLDSNRLLNAWIQLRQRHPILRTVFAALSSKDVAQIVMKPSMVSEAFYTSTGEILDLRMIQQYVRDEQSQKIDLGTPQIRLRLIQGPSRDIILFTIHHALYDAISLPLIISDLSKLYKDTILNTPPNWQHFVDQSTRNLESSKRSSFWKQALRLYDYTIINRLDPKINTNTVPPQPQPPHHQKFIALPKTLTNIPTLTLLSLKHAIPLSTLFLLSFARSLSTLTKTTNPIFGTFTLGRSASSFPGLSALAGPCLNILPLVVRSPAEEPWHGKAREFQRVLAERIPFEQDGLPDVLQWASGVGGEGEADVVVPFNAFVNVLWHEGEERGGVEGELGGDEGGEMFQAMNVGVPSDFVVEEGFESGESSLEALRSPRMGPGVFVDVALSRDGESVDIGARIEGGVIGDEEAREWLMGIGKGVSDMLDDS